VNPLDLITAVNLLLGLAANAGIAWTRLRAAIDKAHAEGRKFDLTDLHAIADQTQADLDALRAAIDAAKVKPTP